MINDKRLKSVVCHTTLMGKMLQNLMHSASSEVTLMDILFLPEDNYVIHWFQALRVLVMEGTNMTLVTVLPCSMISTVSVTTCDKFRQNANTGKLSSRNKT